MFAEDLLGIIDTAECKIRSKWRYYTNSKQRDKQIFSSCLRYAWRSKNICLWF